MLRSEHLGPVDRCVLNIRKLASSALPDTLAYFETVPWPAAPPRHNSRRDQAPAIRLPEPRHQYMLINGSARNIAVKICSLIFLFNCGIVDLFYIDLKAFHRQLFLNLRLRQFWSLPANVVVFLLWKMNFPPSDQLGGLVVGEFQRASIQGLSTKRSSFRSRGRPFRSASCLFSTNSISDLEPLKRFRRPLN